MAYGYDALHRRTRVEDRAGGVTTYAYDAAGNVSEVRRPDGTYTTAGYTPLGQVDHLTNYKPDGKEFSSYAHKFDQAGRIRSVSFTEDGQHGWQEYQYTERGQLKKMYDGEGNSYNYEYDGAGNLVQQRVQTAAGSETEYYYYDGAGRIRFSHTNGPKIEYVYDNDGNLIRKQEAGGVATTYAYTEENRLRTVRQGDQLLMAALYDGLGNRVFQVDRAVVPGTVTPRVASPAPNSAAGAEVAAQAAGREAQAAYEPTEEENCRATIHIGQKSKKKKRKGSHQGVKLSCNA